MDRRKIVVRKSDVLVVNGYEITGEILRIFMDPTPRVLWAFIRNKGRVMPVPYDEGKVIWLTESDLERVDAS